MHSCEGCKVRVNCICGSLPGQIPRTSIRPSFLPSVLSTPCNNVAFALRYVKLHIVPSYVCSIVGLVGVAAAPPPFCLAFSSFFPSFLSRSVRLRPSDLHASRPSCSLSLLYPFLCPRLVRMCGLYIGEVLTLKRAKVQQLPRRPSALAPARARARPTESVHS